MSLFHFSQTLEGYAALDIISTNCTKVQSPLSSCRICQDICPKQALQFSNDQWSAMDCIGCGLCVTACPNHVFRLDEDALLSATAPDKPLSISCRHNPAPYETDLVINCFQQLYPELILRLLANTQQLTLYADEQTCSSCINHWFTQSLTLQLEPFGLPLDKLTIITNPKAYTAHLAASGEKSSRRDFFRQLFHDTKVSSQKAVVHSVDRLLSDLPVDSLTAEPATVLPIRRAPLKALYSCQNIDDIQDNELPYRRLAVEHCTFCGACTTLCPTNALTLRITDENKMLQFQPILCTQCHLCQDICLQKGLYWSDRITVGELLQVEPQNLVSATSKTCSICGHEFYQFPDNGNICPFCSR